MKTKSIAFLKLRHRNEAGYLDQLYALQYIASHGFIALKDTVLTRRERLNYDSNCRYHHCTNIYLQPSFN